MSGPGGRVGEQRWWGEAPERPGIFNGELKFGLTAGVATPIGAPSRVPACGNNPLARRAQYTEV
jgi:hypothetical protein